MFHFSTTLPHLFLSVLLIYSHSSGYKDFPRGSDSKESVCNEGDLGSILGSRRSPGKENCNPLQYSWLRNPMDRRVWATVHGVSPWGHKRVGHDWETNIHTLMVDKSGVWGEGNQGWNLWEEAHSSWALAGLRVPWEGHSRTRTRQTRPPIPNWNVLHGLFTIGSSPRLSQKGETILRFLSRQGKARACGPPHRP